MSRPWPAPHPRGALATAALLAVALLGGSAAPAVAATRLYVIAIGYNQPPPGGGAEGLRALRYADDDAAALYRFTSRLAQKASLLTVLDTASQRRFPGLAELARPPSLAELRRLVAWHRARFEADRREGHDPVLLISYSGHGARLPGRPPALTLLDGPLTQAVLYDEVLARLPARYVHLLVDACHAEAVVRPRDVEAQTVAVSERDVRTLAAQSTLERFPHVGAVIATSTLAQAHEWDAYQRGIFTHQVLSGLRGAADVDGDGRIEYSELYAFVSSANREVSDPRARLSILVRPPALNRRAPIVTLGGLRGVARLVGTPAGLGHFHVEDALGNRLADVRAEPGFRVELAVPAATTLHVRTAAGEAELVLGEGERRSLEALRLERPRTAPRGALASSLRRGLFATAFGPRYYLGFIDARDGFVPVPLTGGARADAGPPTLAAPRTGRSRAGAWIALGAGAVLAAAAGVTGGLAVDAHNDFQSTVIEREAAQAAARFRRYQTAAIATGAAAGVAAGAGLWLLLRSRRPAAPPAQARTSARTRARLVPGPGLAGGAVRIAF